MAEFTGTARRLQLLKRTTNSIVYYDFAHSPSKVRATVSAVKEQFPQKSLIAILELHTYSSLNRNFMPEYAGTLDTADRAVVYFNRKVIQHKGLEEFTEDDVKKYFKSAEMDIFSETCDIEYFVRNLDLNNVVLLLMSSGNFGGLDLKKIFQKDF